jgi:hypothetical protein
MALRSNCIQLARMDIGAYHRIEGELVRGATTMLLRAKNGVLWQLGKLNDVADLINKLVIVEGIMVGVEALNVSWVEPLRRTIEESPATRLKDSFPAVRFAPLSSM